MGVTGAAGVAGTAVGLVTGAAVTAGPAGDDSRLAAKSLLAVLTDPARKKRKCADLQSCCRLAMNHFCFSPTLYIFKHSRYYTLTLFDLTWLPDIIPICASNIAYIATLQLYSWSIPELL